jgi:hypothetical protein
MLTIIIEGTEFYDEETESFETLGDLVLELEHSLATVSKWESKYKKPFLGKNEKTSEEILGYVECMIQTALPGLDVLVNMSKQNYMAINEYIESSESATTFGTMPAQKGNGEVITSELIYYWLVAFNIPFECEHWHLNRLFSLIRICNIKNSDPKKMSRSEIANRNSEINRERKAKLGTTG